MNFKISKVLNSIVERVENINLPLWGVFVEFFIVFFIRDMIEVHTLNYKYDYIIHIHAIAYFLYVISFILLATVLFTGEKVKKVARAFSIGVLAIIPTPLIDRYIFHRTQWYDYPQPDNWANITLSFFQSNPEIAFRGHQIEFIIIFGLLLIYIYTKLQESSSLRKFLLSFAAVFTIYVGVMWLSTPKLSPVYKWLYEGVVVIPSNPLYVDFPYYIYIFMYVLGSLLFLSVAFIHSERKSILDSLKVVLRTRKISFWKTVQFIYFTSLFAFINFYYLPSHGITTSFDSVDGRVNFIILTLTFFSFTIEYIFLIYYEDIVFGRAKDYVLSLLIIASFASMVAKPDALPFFLSIVAISLYLFIDPNEKLNVALKIGGVAMIYVYLIKTAFYPQLLELIMDPIFLSAILVITSVVVLLSHYMEHRGVM